MTFPRLVLFYVTYVLTCTALITGGGALLGAIVFPIVGKLAGMDATVLELAKTGVFSVGMVALIWAPGIGIVLAFRRDYLRRQAERASGSSDSARPESL